MTVRSAPVTRAPSTATATTAGTGAGSGGFAAGSDGITAGNGGTAAGGAPLTSRGEEGGVLARGRLVKVEEVESGRECGYGEGGERGTPPLDQPSGDEVSTRSAANTSEDSLNGEHPTPTSSPPAAKRKRTFGETSA